MATYLQIPSDAVEAAIANKLNDALKTEWTAVEIAVLSKSLFEAITYKAESLQIEQLETEPSVSAAEEVALRASVQVFSLCIEARKHPEQTCPKASVSDLADEFCQVYAKVRETFIDYKNPRAL